jgi:outer membrane protein assembly factor BamE (lipoprotein component of BamABCDE complex)
VGKPSTVSLFDEKSWFFIEREQVNQSVFKLGKTKLTKNNVLEVTFNNYGIVNSKKIYNLDNMNDYKIVKETTQKKYDKTSQLGKILKSIEQKINNPKINRKNK